MPDSLKRNLAADAEALRALHVPGTPLLLANVWDPPSAAAVEAGGAPAIATASAAVAPVNGHEDHGQMPVEVAFAAVGRIAAAVSRPVTADLENGYGLPADVLVERLLAAGACGLNLEDTDYQSDSLVPPAAQTERIAAVRQAASAAGVNVVINARVDVYTRGGTDADGLERARLYFEAGADCVYPIFLADPAVVRDYAALGCVNLLCRPGGLTLRETAALGVARISLGPLLHRALLDKLGKAAEALTRYDDAALWA